MKHTFWVAALALCLSAMGAPAQVGIYFTGEASRVSNSQADTGPFAFLGQGQTSQIFGGVNLGGYYDFFHAEKFDAGVDARWSVEHGNSANLDSLLVGPRVTRHYDRWSPYVEVGIGLGRTKAPLSPKHLNRLEYDVLAGADFRLGKHVDWRAVEIGAGSVQTISSSIYSGGTTSEPNALLIHFSSGFVFRFP